jgi:hypothetical protein
MTTFQCCGGGCGRVLPSDAFLTEVGTYEWIAAQKTKKAA